MMLLRLTKQAMAKLHKLTMDQQHLASWSSSQAYVYVSHTTVSLAKKTAVHLIRLRQKLRIEHMHKIESRIISKACGVGQG